MSSTRARALVLACWGLYDRAGAGACTALRRRRRGRACRQVAARSRKGTGVLPRRPGQRGRLAADRRRGRRLGTGQLLGPPVPHRPSAGLRTDRAADRPGGQPARSNAAERGPQHHSQPGQRPVWTFWADWIVLPARAPRVWCCVTWVSLAVVIAGLCRITGSAKSFVIGFYSGR